MGVVAGKILIAVVQSNPSHMQPERCSLVPRPHPSAREKGLVTIASFLGDAH